MFRPSHTQRRLVCNTASGIGRFDYASFRDPVVSSIASGWFLNPLDLNVIRAQICQSTERAEIAARLTPHGSASADAPARRPTGFWLPALPALSRIPNVPNGPAQAVSVHCRRQLDMVHATRANSSACARHSGGMLRPGIKPTRVRTIRMSATRRTPSCGPHAKRVQTIPQRDNSQ